MTETPRQLAERLAQLTWDTRPERERAQTLLMREYLRRAALWAREVGRLRPEIAEPELVLWPFADLPQALAPDVRAPAEDIALAEQGFADQGLHDTMKETCRRALHFRAVQAAGIALPRLPDPYAPLILMFERGDFFTPRPGGYVEVGSVNLKVGRMGKYLREEPFAPMDPAALDALDSGQGPRTGGGTLESARPDQRRPAGGGRGMGR
ncbi:hypothetical protein ACFPZ0_26260 [Streptomonospora nanhaiensis]|uniref:Uncharacterized protein n=1 Tax=Streptomonospora nanhaiensis TaxID=1323731 RepID=A0A853BPY1_9ACTN|nr:hypothetical protein [Streptomonospora nanhaiensis]NYI96716.1 hypothetical protein [Streptomonospora nanhaiensis]